MALLALLLVLWPLAVVWRTRRKHDEEFRSDRLLWWNAPALVQRITRKGPGSVRKLAFLQIVVALAWPLATGAFYLVAEAGLPYHWQLALLLASPLILLAPTVVDWIGGWYWHRATHEGHRAFFDRWATLIDGLTDRQLTALYRAYVAAGQIHARSEKRPTTTFERKDLDRLANRIISTRITRAGAEKVRSAPSLVWSTTRERIGEDLAGGLLAAWLTCWAVFHRDQLDDAALQHALRPWHTAIGPVPGLDPGTPRSSVSHGRAGGMARSRKPHPQTPAGRRGS